MSPGELKLGEVYSYYGIEYAFLNLRLNGGLVFNPVNAPSKVLVVFGMHDIGRMKKCQKRYMTVQKLDKDKVYVYYGKRVKGECLGASLNNGKYIFKTEDEKNEYAFTFSEIKQFRLAPEYREDDGREYFKKKVKTEEIKNDEE